jgi:mRNA interferase HicA
MRGNELIKQLGRLAKVRATLFQVNKSRGKGSHVTVDFGARWSTVPDPRRELPTGTRRAILRQLGLSEQDLEGV